MGDTLYEHEDGRYAVNPDTADDPGWHRLGPVEVFDLAAQAAAVPEHALVAENAALRETIRLMVKDAHVYQGDCPDPSQPDARDPKCPACRALVMLAAAAGDAKPATQGEKNANQ